MYWRKIVLACLVPICIVVFSCQKIEKVPPAKVTLKFEEIKALDAIPSEYGNLVGVTKLCLSSVGAIMV